MYRITDVNSFDGELDFSTKVSSLAAGGKFVSFSYHSRPLCVQTNKLNCPFGFVFEEEYQNKKHVSFTVLPDDDLIELMNFFDDYMIDNVMQHSKEWFGKSFTDRQILEAAIFNKTVKQVGEYPKKITIRMKFQDNKPTFGIFDIEQNEIHVDSIRELSEIIPRNTKARFLLVSSCVWYVGNRCGYSWDVLQVQIMERPTDAKTTFMFLDQNV
jgi:Family of unknown function (DUF5871)